MKKLLLFAALLTGALSFSQGISVTPSAYTTNQLVNTVLVKNSCLAQVSNVSKSTGTDFGYTSGNGISYFTNTNPNFPMTSGVVLTSGNAVAAQGPNTNVSSFTSTAWGGDAGLNAAMAAAGQPINSKNATSLEFDFVAATTTLSVNFLFASEEYGTYQCESKDAFVFLLTNINTGVTTNIAVTPTTNQPISVATIRNVLYNSTCTSQNAASFGQFNGGGNAATSAINYEGQTILMNASAVLQEGAQYHVKLVVADDGGTAGTDGEYDSAVFFPEGAFNLGQEVVGTSLTQAAGTALCTGDTYTINTGLNPATYGLSWTRNSQPVTGGASINITQTGNYVLTINNPATGCTTTQAVTIEFAPQIVPNTPETIFACDNGTGTYAFNLVQNTPVIAQGITPTPIITYHTSLDNANNNIGALPSPYNGTPNQTIYARVKSASSSCFAVTSFQLQVQPPPTATQPGNLTQCESAIGSGTAVFNLSQQNAAVLNGQSTSQNTIAYFASLANANANTDPITSPGTYTSGNQTIYVRVSRNFDVNCYTTTSFNLVVTPLPNIPDPADVVACDSYTLPTLTTGGYFSNSNGVGPIANGAVITTPQTVYIYAQSSGCTVQNSFFISIVTSTTTPEDVTTCGSYTLPNLPDGQFYYGAAGGTGGQIANGAVITSTQTIYFYVPAAAACTQNENFTVTITGAPSIPDPADVTTCGQSYTLPALTNGGYFSSPGGVGTIAQNTVINTSQTIYIYSSNPTNPACNAENSFVVTINNISITPSDDIVRCGSYILPELTSGAYYSSPNGVGQITNTTITSSQTVYIYAQATTDPACFAEDSFAITINPLPDLAPIPGVAACSSYTLPPLQPGVTYYNAPYSSSATIIPANTVITSTQTVYAVTDPNASGCRRTRPFTVTIISSGPPANPGNQSVCNSYTLPAINSGTYWTGANGTGQQKFAGNVITTTQTLYVYVVSNTTPQCTAQSSFTITVTQAPVIPAIANVVACGSYTLPALAVGNYYNGPDGTGGIIPANTALTASQTVYAWAQTTGSTTCTTERTFTVTIINGSLAPANVSACSSYTLPALTLGNYYTSPNGVGAITNNVITTTQTIYVYTPVTNGANCTANNNFVVTISSQPTVDDPADVTACTSYTLPALTNGQYWTAPNGTGTQKFANDVITTTQILYVYASNPSIPNCSAQNSFSITINNIDVADVPDQLVCGEYVLPGLSLGGYFSSPNGVGPILSGTPITTNQTIYIYAQTNTTPVCTDQESFTVTIKPSVVIPDPGFVVVCGSYILPALAEGAYYTGPGGTGTQYPNGTEITATQDVYIYAETGGTPNCISENMFTVVVNPPSPDPVTACDSYILPELAFGNYFTAPAGGGTPKFAGDVINTSQILYVFVETGEIPNCTDNNSFPITINQTQTVAPVQNVVMCDVYVLPQIAVGNYYTGPGGTGTLLAANSEITTSQTIYVYAQTATVPNCTSETSFTVTIHVTPVTDARSDVEICDQYVLDALTVGNYFELPGGPTVAGQIPHFAGDVITDDITMYIYAQSATSAACFNENSFFINIYSIDADDPADVEACDSYELPELTSGDYYTLSGGPDVVGQQLIPAHTILTQNTDLFIYAELGGRLNCTDEHPFHVEIYVTPVVDDTQTDLSACFEYQLPPVTVGNYFTGPLGTGTPMAAGDILTESRTIYIYAATGSSSQTCFDQHSYFVTINSVYLPPFDDTIYSCVNYTLPALAVGNYFTQPNGQGTLMPGGTVLNTSQTVYVYAETGTTPNCTAVDQFDLIIVQPPVPAVIPQPLVTCAIDTAGHGIFNLAPALAQALGNQPNVTVAIYETPQDAEFGVSPITNLTAYANIVANIQTLYIVLESTLASGCQTIIPLQLTANPRPVAVDPTAPYALCDAGSNDSDGITVFDLTIYAPQILGNLNPAQFSVSYFETELNAENNVSPIPTPASYNSDSGFVYIKITNNATGCYDIVELELIVNPLPIAVQPTPLTLCDENNPGDQVEIFDLTSKIDEITESAFGVTVTFYQTYNDAVNQTAVITTPDAYPNDTPAVEAIFVRVTNNETGCYRIVLLDIRVEPLPILVEPTEADLTECDTTGLGFAQFNLTALVADMINNGAGITVAFYETEQNALDGILPISNPGSYTNAIAYEHTIYVVASSANGCQSEVYALTLHVAPAPQAPDLEDIVLCDDQDTNNQNGMAFIDLTIYEQDIYTATGAAPGTLTIHYFTTEEAADAGAPRITTPAHYNASNDQIIWVRVELAETGCYSLTRFTVKFNLPVDVVTPTMLVKCDDTLPLNDAQATFDLTQKDNEILGPLGIGLGNTVAYFETQANATNNVSPITPATAYTNPLGQNPKTLFVRVTTPQGCVSYTTLTVKVLPLPVPDTTPDALELCDITNTGDNVESFDLTQAEDDIANNDNAVTFNYYPTQADAIAEPPTNEIIPATAYVSGTGSVWVRVSASNGNANDPICYSVVELPLIVHPLPAQSAIVPYAICEQNTDGFATFDLGSQIAQILGPDADPADYTVTFRYNGNLISYSYTNVVANSQVIDVRVVHNGTGCTATVQLTLLVEEQAIAYDVTTPDFDLCDTDGDNDGEFIIDLTQATADIIGTQDPAIHSVTYYPSEADALAQTNAIGNPAAYNATTMTIWAEIINTSTLSGCPDYTSFEVVIELLPEPEISTADDVRTICVDFDTQEVLRPLELRSGVTPNGHTYDWYLDGSLVDTTTNGTYMAMAPGTYTVIVTGPAPNGCVSDESEGFTVIQSGPASPIGIGYTVSNAFGESQVITVLVEGYGEYQYSLYEEGPWQNSNVFTDVAPGAHTIFVRDVTEDACDTLILEEVSIINYPHYFTPNADGYNDTWNVIGLAGEEYQAIVYIFDRYGKLIKQISPDGDGWDGTFNGTKVPADDYWFTVEFTEGLNRREFKAHFALKR